MARRRRELDGSYGVMIAGEDGLSLLYGVAPPTDNTGRTGEFYIDKTAWYIYGPKGAVSWPAGVPIVGVQSVSEFSLALLQAISLEEWTALLELGTAAFEDTGFFAAAAHNHGDLYYTEAEVDALLAAANAATAAAQADATQALADAATAQAAAEAAQADATAAQAEVDALELLVLAMPLTFNFSDTGEARFRADVAMTLTEQATSGTGTIAYEKSTAAAPGTFASTTSPIALQAGAWLKVSASSVTDLVAVHLKRTS